MGMESQPQTAELASFINMQAPRPQPRMRGFQESPEHPSHGPAAGRIGGCGPAFRKGPCFSHGRPAPPLGRSPLLLLAPLEGCPPTLHTRLLPLRGRRPAFVSPGATVGPGPLQVAWPLRWGIGCRTAPHRPPLAPSTHPLSLLLSLTASL